MRGYRAKNYVSSIECNATMRCSATSDASKMEFYNLSLLQVDGWETINASEKVQQRTKQPTTLAKRCNTTGCPSKPNYMEDLAYEAKGARRMASRFVRKQRNETASRWFFIRFWRQRRKQRYTLIIRDNQSRTR